MTLDASEMTIRAVTRVEPGSHHRMENEYRRLLKQMLDADVAAHAAPKGSLKNQKPEVRRQRPEVRIRAAIRIVADLWLLSSDLWLLTSVLWPLMLNQQLPNPHAGVQAGGGG